MSYILIEGTHTKLELDRVVSIDVEQDMILLEKNNLTGKWNLTYTKKLIDDISKIEGFKIVREKSDE